MIKKLQISWSKLSKKNLHKIYRIRIWKGDENMCFVDAGSSIDIEQTDLEPVRYKCMDCESTFKAIGKKVKCPTCESIHVEKT